MGRNSEIEHPSNLTSGKLLYEEEYLTQAMMYTEYVMTSLRTIWGCDAAMIEQRFGKEFAGYFRRQASRHLVPKSRDLRDASTSGLLESVDNRYRLTRKGKFLADGIAAELFGVE